jgi:hypothetical protein
VLSSTAVIERMTHSLIQTRSPTFQATEVDIDEKQQAKKLAKLSSATTERGPRRNHDQRTE